MALHSPYDESSWVQAVGVRALYHLEYGQLVLQNSIDYLSKRGVDLVLRKHNGDQVFHPGEAALITTILLLWRRIRIIARLVA